MVFIFSTKNLHNMHLSYLGPSPLMPTNNPKINVRIDSTWKDFLSEDFQKEGFLKLRNFLKKEYKEQVIYPPGKDIFRAFDATPLNKVKVVILGQDPYHGQGQAQGLCFSVPNGQRLPPSLLNIFKELKNDLGLELPTGGNLEKWSREGVLLLNATLTVRAHQAGSHQKKGWEEFTDAVIKKLSEKKENLVFMLWGRYAQQKSQFIDGDKHLILTAAHPSPLSAHNGFFGCRHFSKANDYLYKHGVSSIDWDLGHD